MNHKVAVLIKKHVEVIYGLKDYILLLLKNASQDKNVPKVLYINIVY